MTLLSTSRVMQLVHITGVALIRSQDSRIGYAILFFCRALLLMLSGCLLAELLMPSLGPGVDEFYLALLLVMNGLLLYRLTWSWRRWRQPANPGAIRGMLPWYQGMVRHCVRDMLTLVMTVLWLGILYR